MRAGVFVSSLAWMRPGTPRARLGDASGQVSEHVPSMHRARTGPPHAGESVPVSACPSRKPYPFLRTRSRASMGRLIAMKPPVKPACRQAMDSGAVPVSASRELNQYGRRAQSVPVSACLAAVRNQVRHDGAMHGIAPSRRRTMAPSHHPAIARLRRWYPPRHHRPATRHRWSPMPAANRRRPPCARPPPPWPRAGGSSWADAP